MLERFGIMTNTQAVDVVTFDFKGTRVRCFVSGSTENLNEMRSYIWNWQT